MSKIRATNSKPELTVRRFLFSHGLRYRKNVSSFPGKPDVVLPKCNTIVFINGCFWHGHSCKNWTLSKGYWQQKIAGNIARDKRNIRAAKKLGWKVIVIWECHIMSKTKSGNYLKKLLKEIKTNK